LKIENRKSKIVNRKLKIVNYELKIVNYELSAQRNRPAVYFCFQNLQKWLQNMQKHDFNISERRLFKKN